MSSSNVPLLTHRRAVHSTKKRRGKSQVKEVIFDEDARREYLTGFRKRNLVKKEAKRKHAQERERAEKLELRKQHRKELAERAAKNVREVEGAFGIIPEDSMINPEMKFHNDEIQDEELEFEDDEQLAVVTVVEDFAADSLRHPDPPQLPVAINPESRESKVPGPSQINERKARGKDVLKSKSKLKAKLSKVHYETKAARKVERAKQRARRSEKAERAGGKQKREAKRGAKR